MKPLKDIRYYESVAVPGPGKPSPFSSPKVLGIPTSANLIGQRVSRMLNAEGFSVGDYDHVYIVFTNAIPADQIVMTGFGDEKWFRYVAFGISDRFRTFVDSKKEAIIHSATLEVAKTLAPENSEVVERVAKRLEEHGDRAQVPRASKETKNYRFEVTFDVPGWNERAFLYFHAIEKSTGTLLEAKPLPLRHFDDAYPLVGSLSFVSDVLKITPRSSFKSNLSVGKYKTPIEIPLAKFSAQESAQPKTRAKPRRR